MEDYSNEYIILSLDGKIIGCDDVNAVKEYFDEYYEEKLSSYCDDEDLDYDSLSSKKRNEIMLHIGYGESDIKVYKTKKVISEIRKSEMDEDTKSDLIEQLTG